MKTAKLLLPLVTFACLAGTLLAAPVGNAFTYQGRLADGDNAAEGIYDLRFAIYDALADGNAVGGVLTNAATPVTNGLFSVTHDIWTGVFDGNAPGLEIGVRATGGGEFTTLTPRQLLTPAPYALYAPSAGSAATAASAASVAAGGVANASLAAGAVTADKIADGTIGAADVTANTFWKADGNAGTTGGTHFLGTTDNQPLEIRVNNTRALRLEPTGDGSDADPVLDGAPNIIGGSPANLVEAGVVGATISGGGATNHGGYPYTNAILSRSDFGTVGGGLGNRVGSNAPASIIAGGENNTIETSSRYSAIGGGSENVVGALSRNASIAGGGLNYIGTNSGFSAIGGGYGNAATKRHSTVPGGYQNLAGGEYSFAAGRQAKANHTGSFVWADSTDADFTSTATDQFTVRAGGGVRFVTGEAGATLNGEPLITSSNAANLTNLNASGLASGTVDDARLAANVARTNQVWLLDGNTGTTAGTHFLGTTDNQPLELKVNNTRALRLEPNTSTGAPNVIGGSPTNYVAPGVVGATIAGGGAIAYQSGGYDSNAVFCDFGTVGGGVGNRVLGGDGRCGTIAGGHLNEIGANSLSCTIGGGVANRIEDEASWAIIGGGANNFIHSASIYSTIGGGYNNGIHDDAGYNAIGGGKQNHVEDYSDVATIAGGNLNVIDMDSDYSSISGGNENYIGTGSPGSAIGGGSRNHVAKWAVLAAIGGGISNTIATFSESATIAGGLRNSIGTNSTRGTIGGGWGNAIGDYSAESTIAGGEENVISSVDSAIGGGYRNVIETNAYSSAIAGGAGNRIVGWYATIPGGRNNQATNYALAAGRRAKADHEGTYVWADSQNADFVSTTNNQFLIRASGGVGIGTNSPAATLHINGDVMATSIRWPARTNYLSVAPAAFHPADHNASLWDYENFGSKLEAGSDCSFVAPLVLPHGAVVRKLTWSALSRTGADPVQMWLMRTTVTGDTEASMASLLFVGESGTKSTATIANATVDNMQFAYFLELNIAWSSFSMFPNIIYSVLIEYTTSGPD